MKGKNNGKKFRDIKLEGDNKEDVNDVEGGNEGVTRSLSLTTRRVTK